MLFRAFLTPPSEEAEWNDLINRMNGKQTSETSRLSGNGTDVVREDTGNMVEPTEAAETSDFKENSNQSRLESATSEQLSAASRSSFETETTRIDRKEPLLMPFKDGSIDELFKGGRLSVLKGGQEARLVLYPPELGKLRVKLFTDDGKSIARFIVETKEAQAVLVAGESYLKDAFLKHGLEIESFSVLVSKSKPDGEESRYKERENPDSKDQSPPKEQEKSELYASYATSSTFPSGQINIYA